MSNITDISAKRRSNNEISLTGAENLTGRYEGDKLVFTVDVHPTIIARAKVSGTGRSRIIAQTAGNGFTRIGDGLMIKVLVIKV